MSNPHAQHYHTPNAFLDRVYAMTSPSEARTVYDEWAASYDKDLSAQDYVYPTHAAKAVIANLPASSSSAADQKFRVLDAGCGTGLVGVRLVQVAGDQGSVDSSNAKVDFTIDGLDISPGMLSIARKTGVYSTLQEADLSQPLAPSDESYDIVACVGTLTSGHVGPVVIKEFVRVVRPKGVIVATILEAVWESLGFKEEIERLEGAGAVKVVEAKKVGIVGGRDEGGMVLVLERI